MATQLNQTNINEEIKNLPHYFKQNIIFLQESEYQAEIMADQVDNFLMENCKKVMHQRNRDLYIRKETTRLFNKFLNERKAKFIENMKVGATDYIANVLENGAVVSL